MLSQGHELTNPKSDVRELERIHSRIIERNERLYRISTRLTAIVDRLDGTGSTDKGETPRPVSTGTIAQLDEVVGGYGETLEDIERAVERLSQIA